MENFDYVNDNRFADNDNMSGMETRPTSKINSLIGEPSISRAPVVHHRCRGGCSCGKMNLFVFPGVCPHRHSPMSIRILLFLLFFAALRLCAMQNLFGSSTNHEAVHQACHAYSVIVVTDCNSGTKNRM
jgi:hypothetical protein